MTTDEIAGLLQPYIGLGENKVDWPEVYRQLAVYLDLILKWNARTNLTAIRSPEEMVRRHFGESLFAGAHVGQSGTLLDYGSGAGFPGVPIQLMRPEVRVTLAESQGKKAAFLREVVRSLGLQTEVWAARVEAMPVERQFETVALRAVDNMGMAVRHAATRARSRLLVLGTSGNDPEMAERFKSVETIALPESTDGILWIADR